MHRPIRVSPMPAQRRQRGRRAIPALLLLLVITLAGCQLAPGSPTAPPAASTATTTAVITTPPTSAAVTSPTTATSGPATPPVTTTAGAATPTRATTPAPRGTATRPAGATPSAAASPVSGAVCAFAPPFAGVPLAPSATPGIATAPMGGGAPAPGQTPPTIPLPDLDSRYTLAVDQFDFAEGRLRAAQTVRVTNNEGCALDRLYFSITAARWGWFALDGVRVGGQPVTASVTGTVLPVALPRPLAAGATAEIAIDFRLDVGSAADRFTPGGFPGTTQTGDILRLAYWFPILSDDHQYPPYLDPPYTATADFDVTLTTPAGIVVAPTGQIVEERPNGDGTVTRRIEARNVRDFVMALSPNYQVARRQSATGVTVEVYYSPQSFGPNTDRPELVQALVERALNDAVYAEERLSALIGPYPYPTLRVVDGGAALQGGIEFPALVMVNLNYGATDLIYHEVGHEWFYGIIGTRTQQDPWIDEGGATFLAAYLEGTLPAAPADPRSYAYRLSTPVWAIPASGRQGSATATIYDQGGEFYTRVLRTMGEPAFWSALQAVYRDHRYAIITPRELLAAWQAASPTDLRPLFKEYLDYPWLDELGR